MNFTMQHKYMPLSGRSFFRRQIARAGETAKRVIGRGLSTDSAPSIESSALPAPGTPGGSPESKTPLYIGAGLLGLLLLTLLGKRRRTASA